MLSTLRHPVFRRLLASHIVALLGTGLATIALGLVAFDLAGSASGSVLGTILAIKMLCFMFVAPVAAALLVKVPTRYVLVGSDLVRAAVAVLLPFVDSIWHIYGLIILLYIASAVFTPTFQATIPRVVTDQREYGYALALSRLAYDLEALLSPTLTAVLLILIPAHQLFFGTALGFIGSAVLIASLVLPRALAAEVSDLPFRTRLTLGSKLLFSTAALRGVFALQLTIAGAGSFAMVQTVAVVRGPLGADEAAVALILGSMGAGSICGALSSPRLVAALGTRNVLLGAAVLLSVPPFGVPLVLSVREAPAAMVFLGILWFVLGVGYSGVLTPIGQVIRATVAEPHLPAVFAAQFSLAHGWWLICYPVAGWLGALVSLEAAAVVMGCISVLATISAAILWRRGDTGGDSSIDERMEPNVLRVKDAVE
jgi:hypothetical protein